MTIKPSKNNPEKRLISRFPYIIAISGIIIFRILSFIPNPASLSPILSHLIKIIMRNPK